MATFPQTELHCSDTIGAIGELHRHRVVYAGHTRTVADRSKVSECVSANVPWDQLRLSTHYLIKVFAIFISLLDFFFYRVSSLSLFFLFYFSFLSPFVLISALYSTKEPTATTMTALQQFGAEMLKLSRGLESVASSSTTCSPTKSEFSSANHFTSCSPQHYSTNKQSNQQQHVSGEHLQIPTAALAAATADSTLLLRGTSLRRSARRGRKR